MIHIGTQLEAESTLQKYVLDNGFSTKVVFITCPPNERPSPNAALIKQSPHSVLRPHFHQASQFQIFVAGGGKLGRHDIKPFTAHYAGQQTGYGPIIAGPEGISYFTLRPVTDTGILVLAGGSQRGGPVDPEAASHERCVRAW